MGIGASAGGLEALEEFLAGVPADCGMGFVVVQHQDPGHQGLIPELLQRSTPMPVALVKDGAEVRPGFVYVIPTNRDMSLLSGRLHLFEPTMPRGLRLPIDFFFRSLAADRGEQCVGVVLSGMGTDGTLGIRAVKEAAGLVAVQAPETAKFAGMPRSAADTGLPDLVAPASELGGKIVAAVRHWARAAASSPEEDGRAHTSIEKILILLREKTGHDFSPYKRSSIQRRVERRMGLHQIDRIDRYVRYLRENLQERDLLFSELLIGVTSFFRDPEAWKQLSEEALPLLLRGRPAGGAVRAWVPGCSTGEEAYSLAIAFREAVARAALELPFTLQVFATDLDRAAIDRARQGVYPANIAADVPAARLARYFVKEEDGRYRVSRDVRETVTFAVQNVMMDPPFTRLDVLVCRNLFIYLTQEVQRTLLPLFHYALNPGGILFLGAAESASAFGDLFDVAHEKWRIYRRRELAAPARTAPIQMPALSPRRHEVGGVARPAADLHVLAEQAIRQRFGPAAVVANARGDILFISGRTGKYLEPAAGKATLNLFAMVREGLRYELHGACRQTLRDGSKVHLRRQRVKTNGHEQLVDVTVEALDEPEPLRGMLLVAFQDLPETPARRGEKSAAKAQRGVLAAREQEIADLRAQLQTLREEMQNFQEELRSSNEELQSTNEELQSTNEELTTSKEEMQSLNEELQTVNAELQAKLDELSRANSDMKNLLNSTDIATLFLDGELRIRRFTTPATRVIKLIASDVGRPVTDIASELDYPCLTDDAMGVVRSLLPVQKQVRARDGRWYDTRVMPYRTVDDRIDGVVITFSEISAFKKLEEELRRARDEAALSERERAGEVEDMRRLHELGSKLWREDDAEALLRQVLDGSVELLGADKGNVQLYDARSESLRIVVASGFDAAFLEQFRTVTETSGTVCGAAMTERRRVLVEDVAADPRFPSLRAVAAASGFAAVQSTPLFGRSGSLVGVLSTHWAAPHASYERGLRLLDLYAQLAAAVIERMAPASPGADGRKGAGGP